MTLPVQPFAIVLTSIIVLHWIRLGSNEARLTIGELGLPLPIMKTPVSKPYLLGSIDLTVCFPLMIWATTCAYLN
jgi:hypothetical protein